MNSTGAYSNISSDISKSVAGRQLIGILSSRLFTPVLFQIAADIIAILFSYALFSFIRYTFGAYDVPFTPTVMHIIILPAVLAAYFLPIFWISGLYGDWFVRSPFDELFAVIRTTFWSCFALFVFIIIDTENFHKYRLKIIIFWIVLFSVVFLFRFISRLAQRSLRRKGFIVIPTVIFGSSQRVAALLHWIGENPSWGYSVQGIALEASESNEIFDKSFKVVDGSEAEVLFAEIKPKIILISVNNINHQRLLAIATTCSEKNIRLKIVPDLYEIFSGLARALPMYGAPLIEINTTILRPWQETAKRIFDITFSLFVIILGMPIWLLIAFAVRLGSKGNIIFSQMRVGKNGKLFRMYKFRSMVSEAEKLGQQWTTVNDPRVTKFGRLLRKTHLDEIPQFWNVLIGDMSIVGPRPEQPKFVEKYNNILPYYSRRLIVRPGITGWWQVKYRAYTESVQEIESRLRDDFYYIENLSLKLDFEILIRTVYCIVSGHGQT